MNTLTKHEIVSVAGGINLYCDPLMPERVLPAPASSAGVPLPPDRWPICPFVPQPEWAD